MIDPRTLPDPLPIEPLASPPDVDVVLPGSKSITNRALVCAALAEGQSVLRGALFADDTRAMLGVLDGLGISTRADEATATIEVDGCGGHLPGRRRTSMPTSRGRPPALRCRSQRSARCRSSSTLIRRCGAALWEISSRLFGRWVSRSPNSANPIDCRLASRVRSTGPRHRCRAIRRASSSPAFCSPVGRRRCG